MFGLDRAPVRRGADAMTVLLVLHAIVAATASAHVLLHKRDVRAAFGWVATVWFAPALGPALYALFGLNRITRRAERLGRHHSVASRGAPTDERGACSLRAPAATLNAVGRQVSGNDLTFANTCRAFENGTESYPHMLDAIEGARHSIALASYIFRADRVGETFTDALLRAQGRGVDVRVLVDSVGSGLFSPVVRRLAAEGIRVVRFTRDLRPWRMTFLNLRNHKKVLAVDGRTAFVGGLNFSDENLAGGEGGDLLVRDVHFRVEGPVVRQVVESFAADISMATGEQLRGAAWFPVLPGGNAAAPDGRGAMRAISSGPDGTLGAIETLLAVALSQARERVRIVTPYFLPDRVLSTLLRLAALKGVRVEIVVPERSDNPLFQMAFRANLRFARNDGLRIGLSSPPFDHAKLVTVDAGWCAFGSPNWDVRSLRLNFELLVECYDPQVIAICDALIDARMAAARPLHPRDLDAGRPRRVLDATARLLLPYL